MKKKIKDYTYKADDEEPGERNGIEAMVETIAAKRPLMYVRDGSQKSLFFFQKQFAWDFIWHKNLEI